LNLIDSKESNRQTVIVALAGLASLDETVLNHLDSFSQLDDLNYAEKLYLAMAYAKLGDYPSADELLGEVVDEVGETFDPGLRLNTGEDQDDILSNTALAASVAAITQSDDARRLFNYIVSNYPDDILIGLDKIAYISEAIDDVGAGSVEIIYSLDNETVEKTIEEKAKFSILLSPEQFDNFSIDFADEDIAVISKFDKPFDESDFERDPNISVSRSYFVNGSKTNIAKTGDLIKVVIDYNLGDKALDGCYEVTDYLPSGLRIVSHPYSRILYDYNKNEHIWYPHQIEGQKISFCVYKNQSKSITYYARVVSPGQYTASTPIIQSLQSVDSLNYMDSPQRFEIQ
jgi:hypothetical protein